MLCSSENKSIQELVTERHLHTGLIKQHLATVQNRIKLQADKLRTDRKFQVGDRVLLKLQPYAQHSVVNRPYHKIAFKFFGPYTVVEKVGSAAYKLDLPDGSTVRCILICLFRLTSPQRFCSRNPSWRDTWSRKAMQQFLKSV
jgi:hypothetical protein